MFSIYSCLISCEHLLVHIILTCSYIFVLCIPFLPCVTMVCISTIIPFYLQYSLIFALPLAHQCVFYHYQIVFFLMALS